MGKKLGLFPFRRRFSTQKESGIKRKKERSKEKKAEYQENFPAFSASCGEITTVIAAKNMKEKAEYKEYIKP